MRSRYLNGWYLFALIAVPMCATMLAGMADRNLSDPAAVASMIALSVRFAVPWLFIAFAASSLVVITPGSVSRWVLKNRRIFGLSFAAGMAWQLFFILIARRVTARCEFGKRACRARPSASAASVPRAP